MRPEKIRRAPPALARDRPLPSAEDATERVAIMCEACGSDSAMIRGALLRQWGFDGDVAFVLAHRERLRRTLDAIAVGASPRGDMRRLLSVTSAFVASPWYANAVRHGWSDVELFGIDWDEPVPALADCGLVVWLALACPQGYRLATLEESCATLVAHTETPVRYRRFTHSPLAVWFAPLMAVAAPQACAIQAAARLGRAQPTQTTNARHG